MNETEVQDRAKDMNDSNIGRGAWRARALAAESALSAAEQQIKELESERDDWDRKEDSWKHSAIKHQRLAKELEQRNQELQRELAETLESLQTAANTCAAIVSERGTLRQRVNTLTEAMRGIQSLLHFYGQREMNSPSNNQEAVRDTRDKLRAFDAALSQLMPKMSPTYDELQQRVGALTEALRELVLEVESYRRCHGKLPVYQEQVDMANAALSQPTPQEPAGKEKEQ
jgi:chromosome segregation ATPase